MLVLLLLFCVISAGLIQGLKNQIVDVLGIASTG